MVNNDTLLCIAFVLWFAGSIISAIIVHKSMESKEKKISMSLCLAGSLAFAGLGLWLIVTAQNRILLLFGIFSIAASLLLLIFRGGIAHNQSLTWDITEIFKTPRTDD